MKPPPTAVLHWAAVTITAFLIPVSVLAQSEGSVTIRVLDDNGRTINCGVALFANLDSHVDLKSHFEGLRGTHIPYGTYVYTLWRKPPGVAKAEITGRVEVRLPDTLSLVRAPRFSNPGYANDARAPSGFVMNGRLDPIPTTVSTPTAGQEEDLVWIRLSPIMGNAPNLDVEVDSSGAFRIYKPLGGRYLLVVNRGNQVLHVQLVVFQQGLTTPKPFVIRLSDRSPTPMCVQ